MISENNPYQAPRELSAPDAVALHSGSKVRFSHTAQFWLSSSKIYLKIISVSLVVFAIYAAVTMLDSLSWLSEFIEGYLPYLLYLLALGIILAIIVMAVCLHKYQKAISRYEGTKSVEAFHHFAQKNTSMWRTFCLSSFATIVGGIVLFGTIYSIVLASLEAILEETEMGDEQSDVYDDEEPDNEDPYGGE